LARTSRISGSALAIASTWSEDSLRPGPGVGEAGTGIGVSEDEAWLLGRAAAVVSLLPASRAGRSAPEIGSAVAGAGEGATQATATSATHPARRR
jgi:hypothetical protein